MEEEAYNIATTSYASDAEMKQAVAMVSIAISLKRIADSLALNASGDFNLADCIEGIYRK